MPGRSEASSFESRAWSASSCGLVRSGQLFGQPGESAEDLAVVPGLRRAAIDAPREHERLGLVACRTIRARIGRQAGQVHPEIIAPRDRRGTRESPPGFPLLQHDALVFDRLELHVLQRGGLGEDAGPAVLRRLRGQQA